MIWLIWLLRLGLGLLMIYLGICLVLFLFQRSLLYFPTGQKPVNDFLTLQADGAQLIISQKHVPGEQALLYFGGNAEDVRESMAMLAQAFPQHALYLMHYRGYGGSAGKPQEQALHADALLLYEHVRTRHAKVSVLGRSLGTGVAVRLAGQRELQQLLLVTPYDSIVGLAQRAYPYVPVNWLLLDRFESWQHAPRVKAPTRVVVAERDEVIPLSHTQTLLRHFPPGLAQMQMLAGEDHNSILQSSQFAAWLRAGNE